MNSYRKPQKSRQSPKRETLLERSRGRRTVLLVTNGEKTEPNYFEGVYRTLPKGTFELEILFHHGNQIQVVERAIEKREEANYKPDASRFDEVWVVLDTEGTREFPFFAKALETATKNEINYVYSNRQIEVWFLFHFPEGRQIDSSLRSPKLLEALNDCLARVGCTRNYKKSGDIYGILKKHGDEQTATEHAENILRQAKERHPNEPWKHNPSTTVHTLVRKLREMADEYDN